jgi:hypothetical protein
MDAKIEDWINRAKHWRSGHYRASALFQIIEWGLGIPSVFIGTIILGFAFYSVERLTTPLWTQYTLAGLSVVQGILISVQAYLRPAALSEQHRTSAARYAAIIHAYEKIALEISVGRDFSLEEIERIIEESNNIAKESRPLPGYIMREFRKSLNLL